MSKLLVSDLNSVLASGVQCPLQSHIETRLTQRKDPPIDSSPHFLWVRSFLWRPSIQVVPRHVIACKGREAPNDVNQILEGQTCSLAFRSIRKASSYTTIGCIMEKEKCGRKKSELFHHVIYLSHQSISTHTLKCTPGLTIFFLSVCLDRVSL